MDQPPSEVSPETREWLESMALSTPPGCLVEVGVYRGGTAWHLARVARVRGQKLFLYDTFEGIPYADPQKGDLHKVGDFRDTSEDAVKRAIPDAILVKGVFPESMVEMPPVAFVHADCDQYASVAACIDRLMPLMVSGGVMVFDDYKCLAGADLAVHERGLTLECGTTGKYFTRKA